MNRDDGKEKLAMGVYALLFLLLALVAVGGTLLHRIGIEKDAVYWHVLFIVSLATLAMFLGLALVWRQWRVLTRHVIESPRDNEEQFQTLYENLTIGLYRTTPDGRIVMLNPTGVRMLGYDSFDEISSRNLEETGFNAGHSRMEFRKRLESQGVLLGFETEWVKKDGSVIFVRENTRVVRDENGKVLYYDGSFEDITERRQAEERLEQFFSVNLDLLCIADLDSNFIKLNKAWESILGYPISELEHRKFLEFVHPDDMEATLSTMSKLRRQEQVLNFVNRYRGMDGSYRYIEWRSQPVGNLIYAAARDITERKQAEEELARQTLMFRHLFESSPEAVAILDSEDIVLQVNRSFETLFGYSESDARGRHINDLLAPEPYLEDALDVSQDVFGSGQIVEKEAVRCARDGRAVDVSLIGYPIIVGRQVIGAYAIYRDITERKRAEDELKRNANFINTLLDAIPTPVFYKDRNGYYLGCNRTFTDLMGVTSEEIQGKTVYDLWTSELAHIYHRKDMELMENPSHQVYEFEVRDKDGMLRPVIFAKDVFRDARGEVAGMVGAFVDITDRKRAEKTLKESEEKYRNVVEKSHDGIFLLDEQGVVVEWNQAMEVLTGVTKAEAVGQHSWDIMYRFSTGDAGTPDPERMQPLKQSLEQYFNTGRAPWLGKTLEVKIHRGDGAVLTVLESNFPIETPRGFMRGSIFRDITERKQVEEVLKENEAIFSSFLEHSPVYVFFKDREIRSLRLSKNYEQMLGMPIRDLLGKSMDDLFPSDLAKSMVADDMRILNEGRRITVVEEFNGRVYETTKFPVLKDGKPYILAGFTIDITERKRSEESLKESREQYRLLVENQTDLVVKVDISGKFLYVSPSYCKLFGKTEAELLGSSFIPLVHEDDVEATRNEMKKLYQYPYTCQVEQRAMTRNGWRWLSWADTAEVSENGQVVSIIGVGRDVTDRKQAEEALHISEARWQFALEGSGDGVWDWDVESNRVFFSRQWKAMLGYDEDEIANEFEEWDKRLHPQDKDRCYAALEAHIRGETPDYKNEHRLLCKDGTYKWILDRGKVIERGEDGAPRRIIGTHTDITARRRMEDELRESHSLFHSLVESMPQNVFSKDLEGRFIFANQNYCLTEGRTLEEILGKTDFDLHPPELAKNYFADDRRVMETKQVIEQVEVHQPLGGKRSYVQVTKAPIYDAGGQVKGMLGLFWDVTDQKRAEDALRESEELHRKMNENSPMGMHFYKWESEKLIFTGANPAADRLLGVDNSQFIGKAIEDAFPPLSETEVPQRYREAAENGILWATEQIVYDDGKVSGAFEVKAFQTTPDNMVAVFADITARKQAEEEIHKLNAELEQRVRERTVQLETTNKELEAFSYSVSHDLRAPLRGIDGWSQALLEDYYEQLDEQGRQYIDRVRSETQRMGHLIDDMLKLSRLTRAEMTMQQVDLSALAQSITDQLMQGDPQRQVDFIIQPDVTAEGDPNLLEAALSNLLGNAFKFTGKCPQARIEFGQSGTAGSPAFFVRDNGAGFDMSYAQKLFGAFQRMHKASEFPGTGVGLAIVQRIIHRHGGRIWAEAEVGKGTVFYFTLKENE